MGIVDYSKKIKIFMITFVFLLCYSSACFAESKIKMKFDEQKSTISKEYSYNKIIEVDSQRGIAVGFTYWKDYDFEYNFDKVTHKCKPQDAISFLLLDGGSYLKNLRDEIVLTGLKTGKTLVVPMRFTWEQDKNNEYYIISQGFLLSQNPAFADFIFAGEPFRIDFSFTVPPENNLAQRLALISDGEDFLKLQSVIDYDIYEDPTQEPNMRKAMVASIARKVEKEYLMDRNEFGTYSSMGRRSRWR